MSAADGKRLNLDALGIGMPGLTPTCGASLAEAAAVCLENREHQSGVTCHLTGMKVEDFPIEWSAVDEQMRRTYNDLQEATERGAYGIAILVVQDLTGKVVIERSRKGPGFDYWLGDDDDGSLFVGKARLEVSGILSGQPSVIQSRLREKKDQIKPSEHLGPGYVAIVEFGTPAACVVQA
jgi:hypothetical protein